jgi:hypothetical protein
MLRVNKSYQLSATGPFALRKQQIDPPGLALLRLVDVPKSLAV